jgi:exonuclease SbcC
MAAELAGTLESGEPCPVCGSPEHPEPGRPVDARVTAADEEQARLDEQAAHTRREEAASRSQQAAQEVARLQERLGERTEDELASELAETTAERDQLQQRTGVADQRARELADVEASAERLSTELGEVRTRIASARAEIATLTATVDEREARLREACGEHATITDHRAHLVDRADRADRLLTARAAAARADDHLDEQRSALRTAAVEAGFAGEEAAVAAEREQRRVAELDEALAEAQRRRAVARAALDSDELADVDPDADTGVDAAAEAAETARAAAERAAGQARSAEQRSAEVAELAERLRSAWAELGPVQAEQQELEALSDLVNGRGQNARKMSLRSYVLAARLEEVAVAATRRLQGMSGGRYSFVHTDEAGRRGTRGGLGLDVLDDYSGMVRPTNTLSGGESFLASLSLALGLADVVAAETGGAVLDTLFIDEGFGSLDAGTLDLVMDALDELRAGGRVIGLVSHVDEMRQRIPFQLRVRKSRRGSTLDLAG